MQEQDKNLLFEIIQENKTTASGIKKVCYVCVPCGKYHTVSQQQSNRILIERYNDENIGSIWKRNKKTKSSCNVNAAEGTIDSTNRRS